ncbi:MAG: AMP-binding protein [Corynebacterium sp.]|nr:AMP-binding protein [Corynebacterium sp.]
MHSTMQEIPLSVARILEYGRTVHSETTIKTAHSANKRTFNSENSQDFESELTIETTTFGQLGARTAALAHVFDQDLRVHADSRVATFMYNCSEHMEIFFAAACKGAIFHPLNIQLSDDQLIFIINHAQNNVIFCDPRLATRLARIVRHCACVKDIIFTTGYIHQGFFPTRVQLHQYEELLSGRPTTYSWPELNENTAAALCYTTGTTGEPKGVLYSHRALYLHSMSLCARDSFALGEGRGFLCGAPIYHVLSWGVPLAAFMAGSPLVFANEEFHSAHMAELIAATSPLLAHGAPSLWIDLFQHYVDNPPAQMSLEEIFVGGAAAPAALMHQWDEAFGVDIIHLWGMTETGPVGTVSRPPAEVQGEQRWQYRISQGRFSAGVEYRVVTDGKVVTGTDRHHGEIHVRGPWTTGAYYAGANRDPRDEQSQSVELFTEDGWLRTGDVGTVTSDGFLTVNDRIRDVIHSGGEWIYSVPLENLIMANELVLECAVIGHPDPTWGERPLAVVRLIDHVEEKQQEIAEILASHLLEVFPEWMVPEYWTFVKLIDKTSVNKFDKIDLRAHDAKGHFSIINLNEVKAARQAALDADLHRD